MTLAVGSRLGPYEVTGAIGVGGMGEVYSARDKKLNRDVAVKVLPAAFAQNEERVARFRREAQVVASLNHPNIASIYGLEESDDTIALVLELVPGEDLGQRLKRGAIPMGDAIAMARQIVAGIEAAHEKGIVHRDLKPANIKVTKEGLVKILDFGLAKAFESDQTAARGSAPVPEPAEARRAEPAEASDSPTMTQHTEAGVVLGTAGYMAPEQARGAPLDKRTDIWSFGVVLFEMLTGRRAFRGATPAETLAAVLRDTPAFDALPTNTPVSVRRLLSRCLERDPKLRLRDIGDARLELESTEGAAQRADFATGVRRSVLVMGALGLMAGAALSAAIATWMLKPKPAGGAQPLTRASYPIGAAVRLTAQRRQIAISPDGRIIATVVGSGLSIRNVDELMATPVRGASQVVGLFFSPDGRSLGFTTDSTVSALPLDTREVRVVLGVRGGFRAIASGTVGASWGDDGRIYYATAEGILSVSESGGDSRMEIRGSNLGHPQILAGSRDLLYTRGHSPSVPAVNGEILLHSSAGGEDIVLTTGVSPQYLPSGHLLLVRGNSLMAAPMDLRSRRLTREPVTVAQDVAVLGSFAQYDVSNNGTLIYIPESVARNPASVLRRLDATGKDGPLHSAPREYSDPRVSPDGRFIALHLQDEQNDVWTLDIARDLLTRITFDPREDETPAWSPDGQWLAYSAYARTGAGRAIFRRRADGGGDEEVLIKIEQHSHVTDWSPDGKTLVIEVLHPQRQGDLELLNLEPKPALRPYLETPFDESSGRVSPDGKWMAYRSDESGRNEVYVQSFPEPGHKMQVSTNGGVQPVWSRDGRALYYRAEGALMAARAKAGPTLDLQAPVQAFEDPYARPQSDGHTTYDVFPDGKFVFIKSQISKDATAADPALIAAFNWVQDLATKVPTSPSR